MSRWLLSRWVVLTALLVAGAPAPMRAGAAEQPETVILTARPKGGQEAQLMTLLARHWATARSLHLVREDRPHLTLRVLDADNQPYLVEIFTWRDASIPDHAPAAILAIWRGLNGAVEARRGQPGLEITPATIVTAPAAAPR